MNRRSFLAFVTALTVFRQQPVAAVSPISERRPAGRTGLIYDPVYLKHSLGAYHPESRKRLVAVRRLLEQSEIHGQLHYVAPRTDIYPHILAIHSQAHIDSIRRNHARAGEVAAQVVAGALTATDLVCRGELDNAFCASRPPGHHALNSGKEEGFCYYNAVAVAARYAQVVYHLERVLIVDWDYHHGNGTELVFYNDPSVLFFSTHNLYAYPGTGHPERTGSGAGKGYNINVHLACGTTDEEILAAFETHLLPAVAEFKPELILVSAGFDSRAADTLGCYEVSDAGFVALTRMMMQLAREHCEGRIVSILEGGYNPGGLARAVVAHVDTLYRG